MALAALDFLGGIEAARPASLRRLDRLAVDHDRSRGGIAALLGEAHIDIFERRQTASRGSIRQFGHFRGDRQYVRLREILRKWSVGGSHVGRKRSSARPYLFQLARQVRRRRSER